MAAFCMNVIHLSQSGERSELGIGTISIPVVSTGVILFSSEICARKKLQCVMSRRMIPDFFLIWGMVCTVVCPKTHRWGVHRHYFDWRCFVCVYSVHGQNEDLRLCKTHLWLLCKILPIHHWLEFVGDVMSGQAADAANNPVGSMPFLTLDISYASINRLAPPLRQIDIGQSLVSWNTTYTHTTESGINT